MFVLVNFECVSTFIQPFTFRIFFAEKRVSLSCRPDDVQTVLTYCYVICATSDFLFDFLRIGVVSLGFPREYFISFRGH